MRLVVPPGSFFASPPESALTGGVGAPPSLSSKVPDVVAALSHPSSWGALSCINMQAGPHQQPALAPMIPIIAFVW